MVPSRVNAQLTNESRQSSLSRLHIRSDDFEDISLFETSQFTKSNRNAAFSRRWSNDSMPGTHSSPGSSGSNEEIATPALTSDSSSIRSSLSSVSTPVLTETRGGLKLSFGHAKPLKQPDRRASLPDNTSLETLSRLPSLRSRRKQRESEYDADNGEDVWPGAGLMFNVPMSPALWAQQKRQQKMHQHRTQHPPKPQQHPVPLKRRGTAPVPGKSHSLPAINETVAAPRRRRSEQVAPDPQDLFKHRYLEPATVPTESIDGLDVDATDLTLQFAELEKDHDGSALPAPKLPAASEDEDSSSCDSSSRRTSLTRPENLPPKSPEEERKHLQEYESMIASAVAKEKRRSQIALKQREEREKQRKRDSRSWTKWLATRKRDSSSHKLRELFWRGIPQDVRPDVWKAVILSRGGQPSAFTLSGDSKLISADSECLWPELGLFGIGHALHDSTCRVVQAYLGAYAAVPYQAPLLAVAALLVLHLGEFDATGAIINLFHPSSLNYAILAGYEQVVAANYSSFLKFLRAKFSHLDEHFTRLNLKPQDYLNSPMAGLFAAQLPIEHAARIMDVFIFEGDSFLLRAGLGIIQMNEAWLYEGEEQIRLQLEKPRVPEDEDEFMRVIREVTR